MEFQHSDCGYGERDRVGYGCGVGSTAITAQLTNTDGTVVSGSARFRIADCSAGAAALADDYSSAITWAICRIPAISAIGTFSTAPYVRDLTNSPTVSWISDVPVCSRWTRTPVAMRARRRLVTAFGQVARTLLRKRPAATDDTDCVGDVQLPLALPNPMATRRLRGHAYGTQAYALLATLTIYNEA